MSSTSEWREGRQKALLKWSSVQAIRIVILIANATHPPMEAAILKKNNFHPIFVLLIANGQHFLGRTR